MFVFCLAVRHKKIDKVEKKFGNSGIKNVIIYKDKQ